MAGKKKDVFDKNGVEVVEAETVLDGTPIIREHKPRSRGKANFPKAYDVDPTSARRILGMTVTLAKQPPCTSERELMERFDWYFQWCIDQGTKPTVESFALAMGVCRDTIHSWEVNERGEFKKNLVKKAKDIIFAFMTTCVMEGEINPIVWMFYGKNYYGYEDKKQIELAQNSVGTISGEEMKRIAEDIPDGMDLYEKGK